jgi:hypothetical protein
MDMAFFICIWYSLFECGVSLDLSTMPQRSISTNNNLILNFQRMKFFSLNLLMTLALKWCHRTLGYIFQTFKLALMDV